MNPPGKTNAWLLLLVSVTIPLALAMFPYTPVIGWVALGVIGAIVGLSVFFNISKFAVFIFPLAFFLAIDRVILILTILLLISFAAYLLQSGRFSLNIVYPLLLCVIIVTGLNGIARSADPDMARYLYQYTMIIPILVFIVFYNLQPTNSEIRSNLLIICIVAALVGWISLGWYIQSGLPRRIFGWRSQNMAACFFGMVIPHALIALIDTKDITRKLGWLVVFAGILAGIFVTQTRAIIISGLASILYIGWKDRRALKIMMPAILIALVAMPTLIVFRLAMMFGKGVHPDWSSVGRIQIWLNSLQLIPEHFFLGMGIDSFRIVYPTLFPTGFIRAGHPHNNYIRWLLELGVFGMMAFVYIFFSTLRRGLRPIAKVIKGEWGNEERLLLGINAGIIGTLLAAMVDTPLHSPPVVVLFWIFLAYQMILTRRLSTVSEPDK